MNSKLCRIGLAKIKRSTHRRCWISGTLVVVCLMGQIVFAADDPPLKENADNIAFQKHATEAAEAYKIQIGSDPVRELSMKKGPILRWSNPVPGKQTHGEVFLWTDRGRPEAILSLYEFVGTGDVIREQHEFCSLSLTNVIAGTKDKTVWSPKMAGVRMELVPDAAAPSELARVRLREMRSFAEQVTSEKTTREGDIRQLRLLPQPLYRYEGTHPDILDAALFAYVEGTDPEVVLLIEARSKENGYQWTCGFARLNSIKMSASYKDKLIWEVTELPWNEALDRPDKAYTALKIPRVGR